MLSIGCFLCEMISGRAERAIPPQLGETTTALKTQSSETVAAGVSSHWPSATSTAPAASPCPPPRSQRVEIGPLGRHRTPSTGQPCVHTRPYGGAGASSSELCRRAARRRVSGPGGRALPWNRGETGLFVSVPSMGCMPECLARRVAAERHTFYYNAIAQAVGLPETDSRWEALAQRHERGSTVGPISAYARAERRQ